MVGSIMATSTENCKVSCVLLAEMLVFKHKWECTIVLSFHNAATIVPIYKLSFQVQIYYNQNHANVTHNFSKFIMKIIHINVTINISVSFRL